MLSEIYSVEKPVCHFLSDIIKTWHLNPSLSSDSSVWDYTTNWCRDQHPGSLAKKILNNWINIVFKGFHSYFLRYWDDPITQPSPIIPRVFTERFIKLPPPPPRRLFTKRLRTFRYRGLQLSYL